MVFGPWANRTFTPPAEAPPPDTRPTLHIFTAKAQPLVRYFDENVNMWFTHGPREVFPCHLCGRGRWAENLRVQVYYDMVRIFCREGLPCED